MAETLATYLLTLEFRVAGGDDRDTLFRLREVFDEWPGSRQDLPYPCASIIDAGDLERTPHNLVPTILEETWGQFDNMLDYCGPGEEKTTVLMKSSGARQEFQVDVWTDKKADRQAVAALLDSIFAVDEARSGVVLEGPELYYSRHMRFSLMSSRFDDSAATASLNERRLQTVIVGECDIVSLREAREMKPPSICLEVTDPADPTLEETEQ
jgi:hypothetical protein